jgi:hypothetical protein
LERAAREGTQAAALARDLVKHASADVDKVRIIRDYVTKNIALKGPKTTIYPIERAFGADMVLQAGYGCSADRAVVLHTMLDSVGLDPVFVVAGNAPPVRALQDFMRVFVSRDWLDQVLVRVHVDGRDIYLNDTDEYAVLGSTTLEGRLGLVLPSGEMTTITVGAGMRDGMEVDYVLDLEADGDALVSIHRVFRGSMYDDSHKMFAEMSPEMADRYRQEQASQVSLNGVMTGYDQDFSSYPGRETMTVRVENLGTRQGEFLYLDLPGMIAELSGVDGRTRTTPLYRDMDRELVNTLRINFPEGAERILVQPAGDFFIPLGDQGYVRVQTRILPSRSGKLAHVPPQALEIEIRARSRPMVIEPPAYGQLRRAEDILVENARGTLVLDME